MSSTHTCLRSRTHRPLHTAEHALTEECHPRCRGSILIRFCVSPLLGCALCAPSSSFLRSSCPAHAACSHSSRSSCSQPLSLCLCAHVMFEGCTFSLFDCNTHSLPHLCLASFSPISLPPPSGSVIPPASQRPSEAQPPPSQPAKLSIPPLSPLSSLGSVSQELPTGASLLCVGGDQTAMLSRSLNALRHLYTGRPQHTSEEGVC